MNIRAATLLLAPLFLLTAACEDHPLIAPPQEAPDAVFSTSGNHEVSYAIIELAGLMTGSHGHARAHWVHNDPATGDAVIVGAAFYLGHYKAVRWQVASNGLVSGPERLGELPEPWDSLGYTYQLARSGNPDGVVVGEAMQVDGGTIYSNRTVGFVSADGKMKVLPWFQGDSYAWFAWEVNRSGIVAGWIRYISERDSEGVETEISTRGAVWFPPYEDAPTLLDPLPGHAHAIARTIRNDGVVAGWSWAGSDSVGVHWQVLEDGSISGPYAIAAGFRSASLNDGGHVAGRQQDEAALANIGSGSVLRLGMLTKRHKYSNAFGINNADGGVFRIVGWSSPSTEMKDWQPVRWTMMGGSVAGPVALPLPSGYTGGYASDVSDQGWIAGIGYQKDGNKSIWRAIIWSPGAVGDNPPPGDEEPCNPHPRTGVCR